MADVWAPLESNPDSINLLIEKLGVKGVECVDVFGFEDDLLAFLPKPQVALILCFPNYKKVDEIMGPVYEKLKADGQDKVADGLFFMRQHIGNACGTFALFHALANNSERVSLGNGPFASFLAEAWKVGVEERSKLLQNNEQLASAAAAAAQSGETNYDENKIEHHFIAFVNHKGIVYEIDSRMPFPRSLGEASDEDLLKVAGVEVKKLMEKMSEEVGFSALALVAK